MVPFDLLGQDYRREEEFKYTLMVYGVQCVIMDGMILMLVWYVDNWDLDHQEQLLDQLPLVKDQDPSYWIV